MTRLPAADRDDRRATSARAPRGFTLLEVLVTIGIIVILASILIPVVSSVRTTAQGASTAALIASLQGAIQRYHDDHRAFPGPISNNQVYSTSTGTGVSAPSVTFTSESGVGTTFANTLTVSQITMSENLVLGLLGGLELNGTTVEYNPAEVGAGPQTLISGARKRFEAYFAEGVKDLSWRDDAGRMTGRYQDDGGTANDTIIPEFLDRFSDRMPILYLRARAGTQRPATPPALGPTNNFILTGGGARTGQYDLSQILAYTDSSIGVGRRVGTPGNVGTTIGQHGLRTVGFNASATPLSSGDPGFAYPLPAFVYLVNPAVGAPANPPANPADSRVPRRQDSYILISAGKDRTYGTYDDVTNFGSVLP